jgi:hypothetical protein
MKMPKDLKDKWVKALRSGEYKQGRGTLYTPSTKSFCCLGVLEHICLNGEVETYEYGNGLKQFKGMPSVQFYDAHGISGRDATEARLTQMNDGTEDKKPKSFKAIARFIDKHVKVY